MSSSMNGTASAKRTGEKISKGLVKFHLKSGIPTISEIKQKLKVKAEKEKEGK